MEMQVAHLLRKYNPAEWGGTETAVHRLFDGLRAHSVNPIVYCPRLENKPAHDPFLESGYAVNRFNACVPVWGISDAQKRQLVSVGGNILSFDVLWDLWNAPDLALIHTHTGNRLGGIALTVAKMRRLPLVVSIHGGALDLPEETRKYLMEPLKGGVEWGKLFGWPLRSRKVLDQADAILTCNQKEAALLRKKYPRQRVIVQPHSVPADRYSEDHRASARAAFPELEGKEVLLVVGRIDPVKNQGWIIEQAPAIFQRHPRALLVLAGACTDAAYGEKIKARIDQAGLADHILVTGGLPPGDPRLIGLFQSASVVLLPSVSETFGLVILEAWAAGTPVISSRTSGALDLIRDGDNSWLFNLDDPEEFHAKLDAALKNPELARALAAEGHALVRQQFDTKAIGGQVKKLYDELIEEKK